MKPARVATLLAAMILASACAGATTLTPGRGTSSETSRSSAPPVVELLDFEAPLLSGGTFRGADLAGKDVAFWFWAPW